MWPTPHRVAAAMLLFGAACGSDGPTLPPGTPTRPLEFEYFIHPGTVQAGSAAHVRAGVFVGPDLCWKVYAAGVTQHGDSLVLSGLGAYLPQSAACPTALAYDSVQVALPALAAGRYWLIADGLADTLLVTASPVPAATAEVFAAHGRVSISFIPEDCPRFGCRYAGFEAVAGILANPPALPPGVDLGRATGNLGPGARCFGVGPELRVVHLRSFEPETPGGANRPAPHR